MKATAKRLSVTGLTLCALAAGCGGPLDDVAPADETAVTGAVRLDTKTASAEFGGVGLIDETHCTWVVNCVRRVGVAQPFDLPAPGRIRELTVWSGDYIDGFEVLWQSEEDPTHLERSPHIGGWGGKATTLHLQPDEAIWRVQIKTGKYVDSILVTTTKSKTMRWGGNGGDKWKEVAFPWRNQVQGFFGLQDTYIHRIGFWSYEP